MPREEWVATDQSGFVIVGNGGHARDIEAIMEYAVATMAHPVILIASHRELKSPYFVLGMNDPHTRAEVAQEIGVGMSVFKMRDNRPPYYWSYPTLRAGVVVHPSVLMETEVEIGTGTHVNYGVMMTRTKIGEFCTVGPGVHFAGDVVVGDRVFIGIGATIGNLVTIGDDAVIGAGSVVLKDVPAGTKVLGVWS